MNATLQEHLARAAAVARVLRKHGADLEDLADDAPKLIAIAGDLHDVLGEQTVKETTAVAEATAPAAPVAAKKITAKEAVAHVEAHGLSPQDRAMLRASQTLG